MNIGFDASRAFNKNKTGTENYSYQLLKHLSIIDHTNNYYIYIRPNCPPEFSSCHPEGEKSLADSSSEGSNLDSSLITQNDKSTPQDDKKGVCNDGEWPVNFKFITIPYPRLWTQVGLAKQTFKDKLDVLFIPSHTLPLIRKPGLKTVVTVHDLGAEFLPKTHQLKQRAYLKLMTDYQLKTATHLIAVSNATKNDLVKKVNISPKKISVIYEGYNKNLFKPACRQARPLKTDELTDVLKQYDIEYNNYFLFVGTIQPRKNLERLIRAFSNVILNETKCNEGSKSEILRFAQNDKIKLVFAGNRGWMSDEIYELPKKLGIMESVKFLGYVPDENLPALYNGAIALLFPSLFEGFGLPILEAMACGTPVLTSNISSMPEIADKAAIMVDPYSEKEIAQGISRLYSDQKLRNKLRIMGIAQSKKFSWEKCAQETLSVFGKLDPSV